MPDEIGDGSVRSRCVARWWRGSCACLALCIFNPALLIPSAALAQGTAQSPVAVYGVVPSDAGGVDGLSATAVTTPAAADRASAQSRGELVVAPLPMVNPTLENGLALVAGYVYRLDANDTATPPSLSAAGGFATSNDSWAAAIVQTLHLARDRFRVLAVLGYGDVNYAFFGVGESAGRAGVSIELNQAGTAGVAEGLVRVAGDWYAGARYQFMDMTVSTAGIPISGGPTLPAIDADLRTAALGPSVTYDSRDNQFYPRRGMQLQGIASFYGQAIGGRRSYQAYQGWVNRYHGVGARHVLAWHAGACAVDGSAPFYDLCMLGKSQDLRGYSVGQYRDRAMLAAQTEWRSELWWRFGGVLFMGAGAVAPDIGSFTWKEVLPGGGAGLRFTLARRNHVNLRVDYAWGKDSSALYVGVIEAF